MCEGSFLPSSFGPHQKHTEFESSLRSYPINPFPFCAKGGSHPMWRGHSCPRDPIPDDVGASVLARAPLTIVILEEAESCARAGLPTKDLRISGLPRMLRRNLVQSKPGT